MPKTDNKKNIYLVATLVSLVVLGLLLVFVAPRLSLFATNYSNSNDKYVTVEPGKDYSRTFYMPCSTLTSAHIDLKEDEASNVVTRLDGELLLLDENGAVIFSRPVSSVYETTFSLSNLSVEKMGVYSLVFRLHSLPEGALAPSIAEEGNGSLYFEIYGRNAAAPGSEKFIFIYVLIAILVLLFVNSIGSTDLKKNTQSDYILFGAIVLMSTLFLSQYYDLLMISKMALRLLDSIKAGKFFHFYDYAYQQELLLDSPLHYFGYNYSIPALLPISIVLLPFSFVTNGDLASPAMANLIVMYLDILIAVAVIFSIRLLKKTCKACGMSDAYTKNVQSMYMFSSVLIFVTIAFGQIDILYVLLLLWALPFYFSKKYKTFSVIMAFAVVMKLLPLLIFIPLILLANKKIRDILLHSAICVSVTLVCKLLFEHGSGRDAIMGMIDETYSFGDMLFEANIGGKVAIFLLVFAIVCILCYMKNTDTENKKEWLFYSMLVTFILYGALIIFTDFHAQWLIPFVIATAFLMPYFQNTRLMILSIVMEVLLLLKSCLGGVSLFMVEYGLLAAPDYHYQGATFDELLAHITPSAALILNTLLFSVLLFFVIYFIKGSMREDLFTSETYTAKALPREYVVGRIFVLYGFMAFFIWFYFYIG